MGLVAALLIEGVLVYLLFNLASPVVQQKIASIAVFSLNSQPEAEQAPARPEPKAANPQPARRAPEKASPTPPAPAKPQAEAPLPPMIELPHEAMAAADISAPPPRRPMMGPPAPAMAADTPRVEGSGPHGEPLYAASWYREPYEDELRGYLSTAQGPGWGLIACRTVPDYRVEDCVGIDEYPQGSQIMRAVLAAAWQFRVRPPQIGGRPQVGEWVRIRIEYGLKRR